MIPTLNIKQTLWDIGMRKRRTSLPDQQVHNFGILALGGNIITVAAGGDHVFDFEMIFYCEWDTLLIELLGLLDVHISEEF